MLQSEVRARVARLQFMTKRLVASSVTGDYCSAFKGAGLEFDQLREYQLGDDVRMIDWNSVAKTDRIMVKQFIQERDRTVIILLDTSSSMLFSSSFPERTAVAQELAAALGWIGHLSKDKIGFLAFSDVIERWIPPSRGAGHIHKIIEAICSPYQKDKKTNFTVPLQFLMQLKKRHAILFMLSDFIGLSGRDAQLLKILRYEYDFVAFRILDTLEKDFMLEGLFYLSDAETGEEHLIDGKEFSQAIHERIKDQDYFFRKHTIDHVTFLTGEAWFNQLTRFFHKRMRRLI